MFKCLECGHVFEEGKQLQWTETHGEPMDGCPICRSAYAETVRCKTCGSAHLDDELYDGICLECLDDNITYDTFLEYLKDTEGALEHFMLAVVLGTKDKLHAMLEEWYRRFKADDKLHGKAEFLNKMRKYILNDDGVYGRTDFAEWLNRRSA